MQYDDNERFDLQVKAMLENAEEKVPSRVWSAVSGRLASHPARKPVFWGWLAGAATACAVLAAVFFVKTPESSIPQAVDSGSLAVSERIESEFGMPEAQEEVPEIQNLEIRKVSKYIAAATRSSKVPAVSEETVSIAADDVPVAAAPDPTAQANVSDSYSDENPGRYDFNNPFALQEEHASKGRRISITLDGALLGNDSDAATNSKPWMGGGGSSMSMQELSTSTYSIPLSFGLGVRIGLSDKFSIGTGLNYTLLTRKFSGSYQGHLGEATHSLQYIGIPVNAYYDILRSNSVKFYAFAGAEVEYAVSNKYFLDNLTYRDPVKGLQYSVAAGLGVEFRITDVLGIYVDPSFRYYFNCKQPSSIRTVQPFMMSFEAGLRFDL